MFLTGRLDVRVAAETIEALDGASVVAAHPRGLKGDEILVLDHYLEVLAIKTDAFPGATALARARGGCPVPCGTSVAVPQLFRWCERRRWA